MTPENLNSERYRMSHLRGMLTKLRSGRCICTLVWSLDLEEDGKHIAYGILLTAIRFPAVILRPIVTSALFVLKTSSRCLPRLRLNARVFHLIRRADSNSAHIMVILFCATVLTALTYALAIGWTKTKITSRAWTTKAQPAGGRESSSEVAPESERVYTVAGE